MNMPHPLPVIANRVGGHFLIGHIKTLTTIFMPSSWHSCLSRRGNGQVIAFLRTTQVAASWRHTRTTQVAASWCHTRWQLAGVTHVPHKVAASWRHTRTTQVAASWRHTRTAQVAASWRHTCTTQVAASWRHTRTTQVAATCHIQQHT